MNIKSQVKNTLVDMISQAMSERSWNQNDLSAHSRVTQPVISRLLNGSVNIKVDSIYKILSVLDLIKTESANSGACPVNCDDEIRELCAEVKEIIKSKTHWANSLESNIHSFKAGVDKDKNESKKAKPIPAPHQPTKKQHGKKKVA